MDDRMEELLEGMEPGSEELDVNPWRRPVRLIIWGILLTTVTLNFLNLDLVLPGLGMILLMLGLRSLRRENGGFFTAWVLSIARFVIMAARTAVLATPFNSATLNLYFTIPSVALQLWQLFALRAGLAGAFDRAGVERRLRAMNWLIVLQIMVFILALMDAGNMGIVGFAFLALYVGIVAALFRLPRALGDTGYALRNAPVRLGDLPTAVICVALLTAVALGGYFTGIALRVPESEPFEPADTGLSESLPAEVAELLTPSEAALFSDAVEIQYKYREPETLRDGTVIEFCTAVAELPEKRLLILHYFEYMEGGPKYGDGFDCWHGTKLTRTVRPDTGSAQPTGALVFDLDGQTRRAPIQNLDAGNTVTHGVLWDDYGDRIYGNIYAPRGAGRVRGYVLYLVQSQADGFMFYNCYIGLLHTGIFDTFRRGTPTDMLLSGNYNSFWRPTHLTAFGSFGTDPAEYLDPEEYGFTVVKLDI